MTSLSTLAGRIVHVLTCFPLNVLERLIAELDTYYMIVKPIKCNTSCADPEGGGTGGPDPPRRTQRYICIEFLSNTDPDPIKNHKATKPAFKVGPSPARQRNDISMAFRWRADDDPLLVDVDPPFIHQLKKTTAKKTLSELNPL